LKPPKETKLDEDSAALSAENEARTDAKDQTETDSALPDA